MLAGTCPGGRELHRRGDATEGLQQTAGGCEAAGTLDPTIRGRLWPRSKLPEGSGRERVRVPWDPVQEGTKAELVAM